MGTSLSSDTHGLGFFDVTHLYEHADPRQDFILTEKFDFQLWQAKFGVSSSAALFWLDHFHLDGLRVDAVASMLYLDYSGSGFPTDMEGTKIWKPEFLQCLNKEVYHAFPSIQMTAEESTAWPWFPAPCIWEVLSQVGHGMDA